MCTQPNYFQGPAPQTGCLTTETTRAAATVLFPKSMVVMWRSFAPSGSFTHRTQATSKLLRLSWTESCSLPQPTTHSPSTPKRDERSGVTRVPSPKDSSTTPRNTTIAASASGAHASTWNRTTSIWFVSTPALDIFSGMSPTPTATPITAQPALLL